MLGDLKKGLVTLQVVGHMLGSNFPVSITVAEIQLPTTGRGGENSQDGEEEVKEEEEDAEAVTSRGGTDNEEARPSVTATL